MGTEMGDTHRVTLGHPYFHVTMHRVSGDIGSQVDINTCTDPCTLSNQGV